MSMGGTPPGCGENSYSYGKDSGWTWRVPGACGEDSQCMSKGQCGEACRFVWKTLAWCGKDSR